MISCIEEITFRKGFIDLKQLKKQAGQMAENNYGQYLKRFGLQQTGQHG